MKTNLYEKCLVHAEYMINHGYSVGDVSIEKLAKTIHNHMLEKEEKDKITDTRIDYNDEIISIEDVSEKETIDISVSGDSLFYCNGILTKNSFGLPQTADMMIGLISTEELEELGQVMIKQLKNRWGDVNEPRRFVVGIDRAKMKLFDVEQNAQEDIHDGPTMDHSSVGERLKSEKPDKYSKFKKDTSDWT